MLNWPELLSVYIPVPPWFWSSCGIGLILFAVELFTMTKFTSWLRMLTPSVIVADIAWVVLTSMALIFFFGEITQPGVLLIILANIIISVIAWLQFRGFRKFRSSLDLA